MGRDKEIKPNELNLKDLPEFLGYKDVIYTRKMTPEEREKDLKYWEEESAKLTGWPPM